jgi:hypothetical protein
MVVPTQPPVVPTTGTVLQACPRLLLQMPVASQVPAQRLATGSSRLVTATQAPAAEQLMQVAQSLATQHLSFEMQAVPQGLNPFAQFR